MGNGQWEGKVQKRRLGGDCCSGIGRMITVGRRSHPATGWSFWWHNTSSWCLYDDRKGLYDDVSCLYDARKGLYDDVSCLYDARKGLYDDVSCLYDDNPRPHIVVHAALFSRWRRAPPAASRIAAQETPFGIRDSAFVKTADSMPCRMPNGECRMPDGESRMANGASFRECRLVFSLFAFRFIAFRFGSLRSPRCRRPRSGPWPGRERPSPRRSRRP